MLYSVLMSRVCMTVISDIENEGGDAEVLHLLSSSLFSNDHDHDHDHDHNHDHIPLPSATGWRTNVSHMILSY
jgi:hypothetical protein